LKITVYMLLTSSVKFRTIVNIFKKIAKSVYTLRGYVQVLSLAHVRTTEQPIRRTALLSLKNRNEPRPTSTTTNERNYASIDSGERCLLLKTIARSAPIRGERAWMKNHHSARAIDSVARVAFNMHDPEKHLNWNCFTREFSTNVEFCVSNDKRDRDDRRLFTRLKDRARDKSQSQCTRCFRYLNFESKF